MVWGCAEPFTLPPVPEGEIPQEGAYNFDRSWLGRGRVIDMVLNGGFLFAITERDGETTVDVLAPGSVDGNLVDAALRGEYLGLRHPVAISSRTQGGTRFLYIADNRGAPELLRAHEVEGTNGVIVFTPDDVPVRGQVTSRRVPAVPAGFDMRFRWKLDPLDADETAWFLVGSGPGRIGVWLEVRGDGFLRPVRSDGAFPVDSVAFSPDTWHTVDVTYLDADAEYSIALDGTTFSEEVPVFHTLDLPLERIAVHHDGGFVSRLDDVRFTTDGDTTLYSFDSPEDVDMDWDLGPFFDNIPAPAVLAYDSRAKAGPLQTYTNPAWTELHGVPLDDQGRVVVSVTEQDPVDRTGVLTRPRVVQFRSATSEPVVLAELGTGLGAVAGPIDVYYDGTGILVVDAVTERVQQLDPDEPNLGYNPIPPLDFGAPFFSHPQDVVSDQSGFVYVADTDNHRILRFNPEGALVDTVYSLTFPPTAGAGTVLDPIALEADDDEVWVADGANERIVVLQRAGSTSGRVAGDAAPGEEPQDG
jgi:hypothetical protein